jgi:hypothetical protein
MSEHECFKVLRFDSLKNSPTWGKLFSAVTNDPQWKKCYGSQPGDVTVASNMFLFDDLEWAKDWTCNTIYEPESETIQIWRVTVRDVVDAPVWLPKDQSLWKEFWNEWKNERYLQFVDDHYIEIWESQWPALLSNCVRLEECVYDFWEEERKELDKIIEEEKEGEEA